MHRFDATINGVSLSSLDPHVMLADIDEAPAEYTQETANRAIHPGQRYSARVRRSLTVRLKIHITTPHILIRSQVLDKVADWVGDGGWLTVLTRPNQRLYVYPDTPPALGSSLDWTGEIEVALTAYERPYWEQVHPTVAVITDSGTIIPTGTVPEAYVEVDAKNVGTGNLTEITLTCADTSIRLEGLTVPAGGHVIITYTDKDVMVITADGVSALANRTAESSDDLIARVRTANAISVTADQAVSAVFRARGRFR